jgi:hypothetical protein
MRFAPTLVLLTLAAYAGVAALAGPAPWYQWRSKVDGKLVCAQTPLGQGWEKASGPYRDSHCNKLITQQTIKRSHREDVVRSIHSN